jgi:hypothetical protein
MDTDSGGQGAPKKVVVIPALNSRVGAPATIYLDFDGDTATSWGSYDVDATPAFQGTAPNITEIWQRVAEKFSIFNVNVTTVNPGTFADKQGLHVVIGGDGAWTGSTCGGISYVGSFYNYAPNTAYIFSENLGESAKYVAEAVAHESGHAFGLQHQSRFSGGIKVDEYNPGSSDSAPIMGNSYSALRGIWWYGTDTNNSMQDDISIIAGASNGFGLRSDDHGSGMSNARNTRFSSNKFIVKGVMNSLSDRDFFKITLSGGGQLQLKLRADGAGAMLDAKFRLYRADGSTVVATDGTGLAETITRTLPSGTYYALVYSHGSYGDVGQYAMFAYFTPSAPAGPAQAPAGNTSVFSTQQISSVAKQIDATLG